MHIIISQDRYYIDDEEKNDIGIYCIDINDNTSFYINQNHKMQNDNTNKKYSIELKPIGKQDINFINYSFTIGRLSSNKNSIDPEYLIYITEIENGIASKLGKMLILYCYHDNYKYVVLYTSSICVRGMEPINIMKIDYKYIRLFNNERITNDMMESIHMIMNNQEIYYSYSLYDMLNNLNDFIKIIRLDDEFIGIFTADEDVDLITNLKQLIILFNNFDKCDDKYSIFTNSNLAIYLNFIYNNISEDNNLLELLDMYIKLNKKYSKISNVEKLLDIFYINILYIEAYKNNNLILFQEKITE